MMRIVATKVEKQSAEEVSFELETQHATPAIKRLLGRMGFEVSGMNFTQRRLSN